MEENWNGMEENCSGIKESSAEENWSAIKENWSIIEETASRELLWHPGELVHQMFGQYITRSEAKRRDLILHYSDS